MFSYSYPCIVAVSIFFFILRQSTAQQKRTFTACKIQRLFFTVKSVMVYGEFLENTGWCFLCVSIELTESPYAPACVLTLRRIHKHRKTQAASSLWVAFFPSDASQLRNFTLKPWMAGWVEFRWEKLEKPFFYEQRSRDESSQDAALPESQFFGFPQINVPRYCFTVQVTFFWLAAAEQKRGNTCCNVPFIIQALLLRVYVLALMHVWEKI